MRETNTITIFHTQFYQSGQRTGSAKPNPPRKTDVKDAESALEERGPTKKQADARKKDGNFREDGGSTTVPAGPKRPCGQDSGRVDRCKEYPTATYERNDRPDPSLLPKATDISLLAIANQRQVGILDYGIYSF